MAMGGSGGSLLYSLGFLYLRGLTHLLNLAYSLKPMSYPIKMLQKFVGFIAYINGHCPSCWIELKTCHNKSCHICKVAGYIKPQKIWQRFTSSI